MNKLRGIPAVSSDGFRVELKANIGMPEEAENALNSGADGIGLYRSEFLFLKYNGGPSEDIQFEAYSKVFKAMGKLPVTIRTVDLGADKIISNISSHAPVEKNPLLGWRGIRVSLANPEMFKIQLRAILRASIFGNVRIMFPMICCAEELEQALLLLDEARFECDAKGQPYTKDIPTGTMIEIPCAAITADILAEKSDFFSIGTNDLIQYSLAVDRENEKVSYLSDILHPAVLRLIKMTVKAAREKGIKTAICGELAAAPSLTEILLGLGVDELSMTPYSIPIIKEKILSTSIESCRKLAAANHL